MHKPGYGRSCFPMQSGHNVCVADLLEAPPLFNDEDTQVSGQIGGDPTNECY